MTSQSLIVALAMLLTATSASMAWTHRHMTRHHDISNYSGACHPGPRVQAGSDQGAGAESGSKYQA